MLWDGNFGNRVFAFRDLNPVCKNWNQKGFFNVHVHVHTSKFSLPEKFTTHVIFGQYLVSIYGSIVNTCTMHISCDQFNQHLEFASPLLYIALYLPPTSPPSHAFCIYKSTNFQSSTLTQGLHMSKDVFTHHIYTPTCSYIMHWTIMMLPPTFAINYCQENFKVLVHRLGCCVQITHIPVCACQFTYSCSPHKPFHLHYLVNYSLSNGTAQRRCMSGMKALYCHVYMHGLISHA